MDDPSCTILCVETKNLLEARDAEMHKVRKIQLVLNELSCLNLETEETPEIQHALRLLSVADYIRLGDENEYLLGLKECGSCPPLGYLDRKLVRTKLEANLRLTLTEISKLGDRIRTELPDALKKEQEVQLTAAQEKIIGLQKEQRACMEKLVGLRSHKCAMMMKAAELKLGPHLANELKIQEAQAQLVQTKADLLRIYFINEIFSRTEHSLKAYKEVDAYLDELLSAKQQEEQKKQ